MSDFLLDHGEKILGFFLVFLLIGLTFGFYFSVQNDQRLIKQCLADGRKEYECVSMLKKSNSSAVIVPIIRR